jgi:hypothetical protein
MGRLSSTLSDPAFLVPSCVLVGMLVGIHLERKRASRGAWEAGSAHASPYEGSTPSPATIRVAEGDA